MHFAISSGLCVITLAISNAFVIKTQRTDNVLGIRLNESKTGEQQHTNHNKWLTRHSQYFKEAKDKRNKITITQQQQYVVKKIKKDVRAMRRQLVRDPNYLYFIASGIFSLSSIPFSWIIGAQIAASRLAAKCATAYGLREADAYGIIKHEIWAMIALNKITSIPTKLLIIKLFGPSRHDIGIVSSAGVYEFEKLRWAEQRHSFDYVDPYGLQYNVEEELARVVKNTMVSYGIGKAVSWAKDQTCSLLMMRRIFSRFEQLAIIKYTSSAHLQNVMHYAKTHNKL